jgi:hypothetical protein
LTLTKRTALLVALSLVLAGSVPAILVGIWLGPQISGNTAAIDQAQEAIDAADDAIKGDAELACRIGAFFVGTPIIRQPGQTHHEFRHGVLKAESFLLALKQHDCTAVRGARLTTREINQSLHDLHQAVRQPGATTTGGGSSSGSPPSSPPGGGHQGGNAPPPHKPPVPQPPPAPPPPHGPPPHPGPPPNPEPPPLVHACTNQPLPPGCVNVPNPLPPRP